MTKYIKEVDFEEYARGKKVANYRNPYIKEVDGLEVHIIATDLKCSMRLLSEEEKRWWCRFGKDLSKDIVKLECDWFPHELVIGMKEVVIAGKVRKALTSDSKLSKHTGYIEGNDSLGSRCVLFDARFVNNAIGILRENGFDFQFYK